MRALVVYCHPNPESFTAAVRNIVLERLEQAGAEIRLNDLYAENFDPVLSREDLDNYLNSDRNRDCVDHYCADLEWCDTLILVYPTWWYGLPAMLKGWLDRVLLPDVAFLMPAGENETIRPGLMHIKRLGVFTTCGASWWLTRFIGAPGRRTLMRGVGLLLSPRARKVFAAHYLMDSAKPVHLSVHLDRVAVKVDRLLRGGERLTPIGEAVT